MRLARSRPARDAAAAAHAAGLLASTSMREGAAPGEPGVLTTMEAKVLDAAGDILAARGGRALAEQIDAFVASHAPAATTQ